MSIHSHTLWVAFAAIAIGGAWIIFEINSNALLTRSRSTPPTITVLTAADEDTSAASVGSFNLSPQLTTDGGGQWVAVWSSTADLSGTIGDDYDILFSRSTDNGTTWSALAALNTNATDDSGFDFKPQLTTDGAGHWLAVWESLDDLGGSIGNDFDILGSRSTDDAITWSPPTALNTNAALDIGGDSEPQLTTDGAGNWVAVWTSFADLRGGISADSDIFFSRSTDYGVSWTAPAALNSNAAHDSGNDCFPQLTTDGAGHWVAVWSSTEHLGGTIGDDFDILFSRSTDHGVTWSNAATLNTNAASDAGFDLGPQLATDEAGTWVAVWSSNDDLEGTIGTDGDILFAQSTDSGLRWTEPAALNTNAAVDRDTLLGNDANPQIIADTVGNWVAVWTSSADLNGKMGNDPDLFFSWSTDNGLSWAQSAVLNPNAASDGATADDGFAQLATDGVGHWLAVWRSQAHVNRTIGPDFDILVAPLQLDIADFNRPAAPVMADSSKTGRG